MTTQAATLTRIGNLTEEGTSKTIYAGGMNIHYHDIGKGEPLVMLHSYGPGSTAWITFFKNLPELSKHFRCIAMDLPNFAKTGPVVFNEPVHVFQAKTALALMDALGIHKAHVLGNSQGGQTSMVFAYMFPDRINKLVWGAGHIGTGPAGREYLIGMGSEEGIRASREASENPTSENIRRYLRLHIYNEALVTDELVEYLRQNHTGRPDLTEARGQSRMYIPHNHLQHLVEIKAPTLIIWGRYDRTCHFEIGINAFNHMSSARMTLLHTGHWSPFEKPEEYTSHVLNFLKSDWT